MVIIILTLTLGQQAAVQYVAVFQVSVHLFLVVPLLMNLNSPQRLGRFATDITFEWLGLLLFGVAVADVVR